jgi:NTP pyrophosphatase (non-canonical NTP hydrolase)
MLNTNLNTNSADINDRYCALAARTESRDYFHSIAPRQLSQLERTEHAAYGLCTEAGELLDQLKKHIFYGKDLDEVNLMEELGDILWYVALLCNARDWRLTEVMQANINKLTTRYPDKFNANQAIVRDLEAERAQLEEDQRKAERIGIREILGRMGFPGRDLTAETKALETIVANSKTLQAAEPAFKCPQCHKLVPLSQRDDHTTQDCAPRFHQAPQTTDE